MGKAHDLAAKMKRLVPRWRLLASIAVLVAFGAAYVDKKIFSAPTPFFQAHAQAPSAPPRTPPSPGTENAGPQTAEPPVSESVSSETIDVSARPAAVLRGRGDWRDSFKALFEAVGKVKNATEKAGLVANGRPFVVFTETDDNGFRFEAMTPLEKAPEGKGKLENGVEIGASPAGKALKFQHRGPYDDIDSTYEAITAYLDEKGLDTKNLFIEEYLTDMKSGDDESLEVDVYVFLK